MKQQSQFIIYGAGDSGTRYLRELLLSKGVAFEWRDIRVTRPDGTKWLRFMSEQRHETVPQVYRPDGTYLGDYFAADAHFKRLPAAAKAPAGPSAA